MTKKGNKMMNALVGLVVAVSFYSTINTGTECSKIAIMPTGIGSPYFILVKIGETLKERGHEVGLTSPSTLS